LGNNNAKYRKRPISGTHSQEAMQASASAPGGKSDWATSEYAAYSMLRRRTPPTNPIAQKSQPMRLSGRREATTAPIVEKVNTVTTARIGEKTTVTTMFSSHWSKITL